MKNKYYDNVIIGAGPAGLQLAYYFQKNNKNYIILEKNNSVGSFFKKFPIHRKLISVNKIHIESDPGIDLNEFAYRHDWNSLICDNPDLRLKNYTKEYYPHPDDFLKYLDDFKNYYNLNIRYNTNVKNISKEEEIFKIEYNDTEEIKCKNLIICTGISRSVIPNIIGIEHAINYKDLKNDMSRFENRRVAIIGKGNSALETADSLTNIARYICLFSRHKPVFAWDTHFVGNIRAVNNNFYDSYQLKSMSFSYEIDNVIIKKVDEDKFSIIGSPYVFDDIIYCTGFSSNLSILDESIRPDYVYEKYPEINWRFESTKTKNLYFCGANTQSLDYKESTLAFIHGFRYTGKFLYNIINYDNINNFECIEIKKDLNELTLFILKEVSENSCIWQCFKFWGILIVIYENKFKIYRNIPVKYVKQYADQFKNNDIIMITLEYGFEKDDDAFDSFPVYHEFTGYVSKFIHPIIRYYPKNNNRFNLKSKIQCICGNWEDADFIKNESVCKKCINKGYCNSCNNLVDINILHKKGKCNNCIDNKLFNYNANVNTYQIVSVSNKMENKENEFCYELHLMEDLLGRYYSINNLSKLCIDNNLLCYNSTDENKVFKFRADYNPMYRYFDYIFNSNKVNVAYHISKQKRNIISKLWNYSFNKNNFLYFRLFVGNTFFIIEKDIINIFTIPRDYEILSNNKKMSFKFFKTLSFLKKKLNISKHDIYLNK